MPKSKSTLALPPTSLVLIAIASTQIGSALAKTLFQVMSPTGVVLMRVGFAAILLLALWRPKLRSQVWAHSRLLIAFGLALALMNLTFYLAINRVPLGIAVAVEFVGPLGVAVAHSRKWLDVVWVGLAALGIGLLTPIGGFDLDVWGLGLSILAGGFWATYILLSARTGRVLAGGEGLAWAMAVGALVLLPLGIAVEGTALLQPKLLAIGLGVALLSSAVPYSLELEALRSVPLQVFGVLLSLEPVAAAVAGWLILGETLSLRSMIAIALVTIAAAGASRFR